MNDRKEEDQENPLSSEALKRDEWRGDDASARKKDCEPDAAEMAKGEGPNPLAGTMLPPD